MLVRWKGDYELVQRCRGGDTDAWDTLVDQYYNVIYTHVAGKVPPQDVFDVTQDIFLAIIEGIIRNKYEGRSALSTYFYRVASNLVADYFRKGIRREARLSEWTQVQERLVDPWAEIDNDIYIQQLPSYMQQLSKKNRKVMELSFMGLSLREISERLDLEYEAARSRRRRAMATMQEEFGPN